MKYLILLFIVFLPIKHEAQGFFSKEKVRNKPNFDKKQFSWGYYLGTNVYDFNFDYLDRIDEVIVEKGIGFNVGLIGNMRINDYIDLRLEPGVIFTTRNLTFPNFEEEKDAFREVKSAYVHIPLLVKFSTKRLNNFKPFIVAGGALATNLSSNEGNPDDNSAGEFRMETNMQFLEVGFGIDFYLEYFKFSPSIRGVFALKDELIRDNDPSSAWTSNIDQMKTRGVFINFTFQ
jgi:hypothetical protein